MLKTNPLVGVPSSACRPRPWLRSGRRFSHPLVLEAVTMQESSLSEFQLVPRAVTDEVGSEVSSQRTETVPSSPASPATSVATTDALRSPSLISSQASTVAPWTPQRGDRTPPRGHWPPPREDRRVDHHRFRDRHIPLWFAEAFESDRYDSEALAVIESQPRLSSASQASSVRSSPGFELVADTALGSARDEWLPDVWPASVERIATQFNPRSWKFPRVPIGVRGGAGCACSRRCNALTCANAKQSRFCNELNCAFAGACGSALVESSALAIRRNARTGMRDLVATAAVPAGEVIGEYLGHVQLFGPPCRNAPANEGFKMHLKTRTTGNKFGGIDALEKGGLLRLMNHSCNAAARFHEVQTGDKLTVVAVTVRDVFPGEEMAVSYGSKLWFLCRCGWWGCQHRDRQHLAN
ncbi:hypothetical protein PF002_g9469 [Phytophthora fragariae]|uniref:SET domain-containing protein n=2 Tax=Phytophthora fragariae TaxID=53985 RepID=A0A6A3ZSI1_9STRA|nr:hypothetical protein PF003_g38454 [Phytophthora fragariae]KAE8942273.1 hypothetical protein PF009_g7951 [Phytophthora fragariae]KAE9241006.1 hypothetical protein PF002_g9469 [Phytophthora fragariae]